MNIFVGNLSFKMTDKDLSEVFEKFGKVSRAVIIKDHEKHRSKGFGFVEMEDDEEAKNAIAQLNEKEIFGRNIRVNEAAPKPTKE